MPKKIVSSLLICSLGAIFSTSAQSQTLNVDPPPQTESTSSDAVSGTTFGLWNVVCVETGKCVASTALAKKDAQGADKKIVEVRVESFDGKKTIYVQLPTGLLIKPGVQIALGDAVTELEYVMCGPTACLAAAEINDKTLDDLRKAPDMKVIAVFAANSKTKKPTKGAFNFSLEGSGAALDAIAQ